MAAIKRRQSAEVSGPRDPSRAAGRRRSQADLIAFVELMFFAYRDFTGEPDKILADYGLGRAHHRVLHFVDRQPGMRVADLLETLMITKQSLARVLKQLVDDGWIHTQAGELDRRERLLFTTERGKALAARLAERQMARIEAALEAAGGTSDDALRRFLLAMIASEEQPKVARRMTVQGGQ
ncbi:MAG: MarR family transcriptional regulator [Hyphomicrobiales bacterium]|nr:MarR family transcriptional regulator [Hyphomicrobiales bacterium]